MSVALCTVGETERLSECVSHCIGIYSVQTTLYTNRGGIRQLGAFTRAVKRLKKHTVELLLITTFKKTRTLIN